MDIWLRFGLGPVCYTKPSQLNDTLPGSDIVLSSGFWLLYKTSMNIESHRAWHDRCSVTLRLSQEIFNLCPISMSPFGSHATKPALSFQNHLFLSLPTGGIYLHKHRQTDRRQGRDEKLHIYKAVIVVVVFVL